MTGLILHQIRMQRADLAGREKILRAVGSSGLVSDLKDPAAKGYEGLLLLVFIDVLSARSYDDYDAQNRHNAAQVISNCSI